MHFDDALDLRYVGQDYYLRVYVDIDDLDGARIRADFDRLHEHTYGFANPEFEVEMVNARVFAIGTFERPQLPESRPAQQGRPNRWRPRPGGTSSSAGRSSTPRSTT